MPHNSPGHSSQTAPRFEADRHDYLAFVDGLRAVSILAVVGFHVGLAGFPGGYVGVDVFFVISGFLIINQIRDGLEAGRFSIVGFYARRALRILPPYIVVLLAIFIAAPFVLPAPNIYGEYMRQAAISPLMLSNFLFFTQQGYFDLLADEKPFLHTWTLSIEEQFYLLAPILLIALFSLDKKKFGLIAVAIAVVLGVASLAGAIAFTNIEGRNAAFYFPHWRAWEFIAGGLIGRGLAGAVGRAPRAVADAIGLAGLALIVIAITTLDARTPYPSWRAVLPVAGAALVILSGLAQPRNLVARLLSLRWMVGIGLVSYGWYLWHWPILSYLRILRLGEPSAYSGSARGRRAGVRAGVPVLSLRRIADPAVAADASRDDAAGPRRCRGRRELSDRRRARRGKRLRRLSIDRLLCGGALRHRGSGRARQRLCGVPRKRLQRILPARPIWPAGRRLHAHALAPSLTRSFDQGGVKLVSLVRPGCQPVLFAPDERKRRPHGCVSMLGPFEKILANRDRISFVVFASLWPYELDAKEMSALVAQFDPRTRILLMGPGPIFNNSALDCVVLSDRFGNNRDRCLRDRASLERAYASRVAVLQDVAIRHPNVRFVDPKGAFCDARICRPFDGDRVFFRDNSHVLPPGAERIFAALKGDFSWLAKGP